MAMAVAVVKESLAGNQARLVDRRDPERMRGRSSVDASSLLLVTGTIVVIRFLHGDKSDE